MADDVAGGSRANAPASPPAPPPPPPRAPPPATAPPPAVAAPPPCAAALASPPPWRCFCCCWCFLEDLEDFLEDEELLLEALAPLGGRSCTNGWSSSSAVLARSFGSGLKQHAKKSKPSADSFSPAGGPRWLVPTWYSKAKWFLNLMHTTHTHNTHTSANPRPTPSFTQCVPRTGSKVCVQWTFPPPYSLVPTRLPCGLRAFVESPRAPSKAQSPASCLAHQAPTTCPQRESSTQSRPAQCRVQGVRSGVAVQGTTPHTHQLHLATFVDKNVATLDVTMHDSIVVQVGQAGQNLPRVGPNHVLWEGTKPCQHGRNGATRHILCKGRQRDDGHDSYVCVYVLVWGCGLVLPTQQNKEASVHASCATILYNVGVLQSFHQLCTQVRQKNMQCESRRVHDDTKSKHYPNLFLELCHGITTLLRVM